MPTREGKGVSIFASRDESGSKIVAIVLNLDPRFAAQVDIDAQTCGTLGARRVFSYGAASSGFTEEKPVPDAKPASEIVAPYSIKVIEMTIVR